MHEREDALQYELGEVERVEGGGGKQKQGGGGNRGSRPAVFAVQNRFFFLKKTPKTTQNHPKPALPVFVPSLQFQ